MSERDNKPRLSYADAGVDIAAGDAAVERIKVLARSTFTNSVLSEIGSFGGFFKPNLKGLHNPVLVSSVDGVGTKLKLAFMTGVHNTVGEDLANHCVNDILVHGARALFFMDYIATGKLKPDIVAQIVEGFARGCRNAGMALLGGETAEMPGFYQDGEYDLAGFIVGMVDEAKVINGSTIQPGDTCIGLASNGLHTNGYTLARKAAFEAAGLKLGDPVPGVPLTIDQALMQVHRCYAPVIHPLLEEVEVHGMAHITGGGIPGNLCRIIPNGLSAVIHKASWAVPPLFRFLQDAGNVAEDEMYRAFNMGVGYIMVVPAGTTEVVLAFLHQRNEPAWRIGEIVRGEAKVVMA